MRSLRVLIVDDNFQFLESLTRYLAHFKNVTIVGRGYSGIEALQLVKETSPDLLLMDLSMPNMNGIEATRRLRAEGHDLQIVIVTFHKGEPYREAVLKAGADGFICKVDLVTELPVCLESLAKPVEAKSAG